MTRALSSETLNRVTKLLPRLASTYEGEVVATARALERTLKAVGCDWHDLCASVAAEPALAPTHAPAPPPSFDWNASARWCLALDAGQLSARERQFLHDMARWFGRPSDKQLSWLNALRRKVSHDE
jgi:hypothetical protein